MSKRVAIGTVLLLAGALLAPADGPTKDSAALTAYRAVEGDYAAALAAFQKAYHEAKTVKDQARIVSDKQPRPGDYASRFMNVAVDHPGAPASVDALVWLVLNPVEAGARGSKLRSRALSLLQRDYIRDEKLGRLCTQLVFTMDAASEEFLRAVLKKAPTTGVQARACASLALNLKHRGRLIPRLKLSEAGVKEYEQMWGKPAVAAFLKRDPAAMLVESAKLFERVADKYGSIKHPVHGSLAGLAKANLLSLNKPVEVDRAAPEIEGADVAGKKLRLSDHRGKVVLLDFWAHGMPSCRAGLPIKRALLERLAGKPFVMLGVNADRDREALGKTLAVEKISWRSWFDGGFPGGPIATRWNVEVWPTLFLIDARGVVRHQFLGWNERKEIEAAIDDLVDQAGKVK